MKKYSLWMLVAIVGVTLIALPQLSTANDDIAMPTLPGEPAGPEEAKDYDTDTISAKPGRENMNCNLKTNSKDCLTPSPGAENCGWNSDKPVGEQCY